MVRTVRLGRIGRARRVCLAWEDRARGGSSDRDGLAQSGKVWPVSLAGPVRGRLVSAAWNVLRRVGWSDWGGKAWMVGLGWSAGAGAGLSGGSGVAGHGRSVRAWRGTGLVCRLGMGRGATDGQVARAGRGRHSLARDDSQVRYGAACRVGWLGVGRPGRSIGAEWLGEDRRVGLGR